MKLQSVRWLVLGVSMSSALLAHSQAHAAPAVAVDARLGTTGYGFDVDVGMGQFSARIGYSGFNFNHQINQTDVTYDGKLKIRDLSALFDWYPFDGGFRLTLGAVGGGGLTVDVNGVPSANQTYTINGTTYTGSQLGSLSGQLKFGNSVSPFVGLGWGNPVGLKHHLHFLFDAGAIYGGTPNVTLVGRCGSAAPTGSPLCTQLQNDVQAERRKLQSDVTVTKWYPVVNLGLAYRF